MNAAKHYDLPLLDLRAQSAKRMPFYRKCVPFKGHRIVDRRRRVRIHSGFVFEAEHMKQLRDQAEMMELEMSAAQSTATEGAVAEGAPAEGAAEGAAAEGAAAEGAAAEGAAAEGAAAEATVARGTAAKSTMDYMAMLLNMDSSKLRQQPTEADVRLLCSKPGLWASPSSMATFALRQGLRWIWLCY